MKIEGDPKNCYMEGVKCFFLNIQGAYPTCERPALGGIGKPIPLREIVRCSGPFMSVYRHLTEIKK